MADAVKIRTRDVAFSLEAPERILGGRVTMLRVPAEALHAVKYGMIPLIGRPPAIEHNAIMRSPQMAGKRKIQFQGNEVWGEEVDFETEREGWNEYVLHDGTRLKMKSVVSDVLRLEMFQPDGSPVYFINSTNVVTAIVPDSLKRKD